jgi:quercetin dioxygenase-like cupin family protein
VYVTEGPAIRAAVISFGAGAIVAPHAHRESEELFFLVSGSCEITVDSEVVDLCAGDVLVVAAGEMHSVRVGEDPTVLLAVVSPNLGDLETPDLAPAVAVGTEIRTDDGQGKPSWSDGS